MRKFKALWILPAAAIMLSVLTACGGGGEPAVQVLDTPDAQPVYLSFFSSESYSGSDVSKYWRDRFTEKYNKQVYIDFDGATYYADEGLSYRELLEKRMESSAPDDLYIISAEDVMAFEKKGYWMDLSGMDFVDNLSEAALYQSTYNGKVFSVPLTFTGFGFLWNVDLLKEHGLAIPQNLTEFLDVCETLKNNGVLPYGGNKGFGLTVPAMCAGFSELYQSKDLDERIAALNSGETPVSDYLREGFALLSLMIEQGYLDPAQAMATTPHVEDLELFLAGGCAFICTGVGKTNSLQEKPFQMEMTGLPVLPEGSAAVYGADKRLCVNPNSNHLETVIEFVEMVGTAEALERSAELGASMSTSKTGGADRFPLERELVSLLRQPGQIPNQDFALHFNTWEGIRDVARELCGGADVDRACAMLDEKQQADLDAYGGQ